MRLASATRRYNGAFLRQTRRSSGVAYYRLAFAVGVSPRMVPWYEDGTCQPSPEVAERIAAFFSMRPDQFYIDAA